MSKWTNWTGIGNVATWANVCLLLFLLFRDWRVRRWLFHWQLYSGPNSLAEQALALHLGLLQATLVGIGVGLAIMGVVGFKSVQEEAVNKAVAAAVEKAEEVARHHIENRHEDTAKKVGTQQPPSAPEEPDPDTLNPEE